MPKGVKITVDSARELSRLLRERDRKSIDLRGRRGNMPRSTGGGSSLPDPEFQFDVLTVIAQNGPWAADHVRFCPP